MKKNDSLVYSLAFLFVMFLSLGRPMVLRIAVIGNSILILWNVIYQIWEVYHGNQTD